MLNLDSLICLIFKKAFLKNILIYFLLKYRCCTILYKLQVIHNFKGYTPFIIIIKYWLYIPRVVQYILAAYFIPNSLYLLGFTVSPLRMNLQVANFQRCERAFACPIM